MSANIIKNIIFYKRLARAQAIAQWGWIETNVECNSPTVQRRKAKDYDSLFVLKDKRYLIGEKRNRFLA